MWWSTAEVGKRIKGRQEWNNERGKAAAEGKKRIEKASEVKKKRKKRDKKGEAKERTKRREEVDSNERTDPCRTKAQFSRDNFR